MTGFFHPDKRHHHDGNNEAEKQKKTLATKSSKSFSEEIGKYLYLCTRKSMAQ
jgi:hypothetical protein